MKMKALGFASPGPGSSLLHSADWQPAKVPGAIPAEGTAWLRCWVKPHDSFFTKHERNLFEESVGFHFSDLPAPTRSG